MYKYLIILLLLTSYYLSANSIKWEINLSDAKDLAVDSNKPIFLFMKIKNCQDCSLIPTFKNKSVIKYLNKNFISVVLFNTKEINKYKVDTSFAPTRFTVTKIPAIYFIGPNEEKLNKKGKRHMLIYGYWSAEELLQWLKNANKKFHKLYGEKYGY